MTMTTEHKEALAAGRQQSRKVGAYLNVLQDTKPRRGRKRTADTIRARLTEIEAQLPEASLLKALGLMQEQKRLEIELNVIDEKVSATEAEEGFVEVAKDYADRKGITYDTWRQAGVPAEVLKRAGISK